MHTITIQVYTSFNNIANRIIFIKVLKKFRKIILIKIKIIKTNRKALKATKNINKPLLFLETNCFFLYLRLGT